MYKGIEEIISLLPAFIKDEGFYCHVLEEKILHDRNYLVTHILKKVKKEKN